jgi:hypothetical protein
MHHTVTKHRGIITLYRHQKAAFAITSRRGPTPKAVKAQIADLPAGSSGNILVELDEVNSFFFFECFVFLNKYLAYRLRTKLFYQLPDSLFVL